MSGEHEELKDILKYLWPACRCIVTKNLTAESQKRTAPTEDAPPKPPVFLFLLDSRALELSGSQARKLSFSKTLSGSLFPVQLCLQRLENTLNSEPSLTGKS